MCETTKHLRVGKYVIRTHENILNNKGEKVLAEDVFEANQMQTWFMRMNIDRVCLI